MNIMKKSILFVCAVLSCGYLYAEGIKLKTGVVMTGSIVSQTEYVLNLNTSYGVVSIPQRDIVEILPDQHRVLLKGGGELVGQILDIDEFNLRLKTDTAIVNIDVPKIAAFEVYDYNQAEKQQQYIEQKKQAEEAAAQPKAPGTLSFDDDLERAFSTRSPQAGEYSVEREVVRPSAPRPAVVTPAAAPVYTPPSYSQPAAPASAPAPQAPKTASPEYGPKIYTGELPKDAKFNSGTEPVAKGGKKHTVKELPKDEKEAKRYLSVALGATQTGMKYGEHDIGGTGVHAEIKHLWKIFNNHFWLGGSLALNTIPKEKIILQETGDNYPYEKKFSGNNFVFSVAAQYYINPYSRYKVYLLGSAGLEYMKIDKKWTSESIPPPPPVSYESETKNYSSTNFSGGFGLGLERKVSDLFLALELKANTSSRSDDFKDSDTIFYTAALKAAWKF
ncbi:hypothetical protein Dip518_001195 [Parelusimicrobium proximum]|uniref:hypothetical protein n=1 Tax=Parelusimicrobium proximum TaxID=3228953 RepID=UPI003D16A7DA